MVCGHHVSGSAIATWNAVAPPAAGTVVVAASVPPGDSTRRRTAAPVDAGSLDVTTTSPESTASVVPSSSTLMGEMNLFSQSLAQRLTKQSGLVVFVSYNGAKENEMMTEAIVEKTAKKELNVFLQHIKERSSQE